MKKINKYKITPDVYNNLEQIAKDLPKFQMKLNNGNLVTRNISKRIKGSEMSIEEKVKIKDFKENKFYLQNISEPVLLNHSVALRSTYQKLGYKGVDAYINFFTKLNEEQSNTIS
jgi:hypothetical protein